MIDEREPFSESIAGIEGLWAAAGRQRFLQKAWNATLADDARDLPLPSKAA